MRPLRPSEPCLSATATLLTLAHSSMWLLDAALVPLPVPPL
eukprot:COSAG01_NODE_19703_length_994_cov_5.749721_1_plen_40_part_01